MKYGIFQKVPSSFLLLLAYCALTLRAGELTAILLCAAVHEAGHLAAALIAGAKDIRLRPGIFGFEISYAPLSISYTGQIVAALAGPAAGLLLWFAAASWPADGMCASVAPCSLALSLINLLPLSLLDGGTVVLASLDTVLEADFAEKITDCLDVATLSLLSAYSIVLAVNFACGAYVLLPFCLLISYCANENNVVY